jgi:hypothetical protein
VHLATGVGALPTGAFQRHVSSIPHDSTYAAYLCLSLLSLTARLVSRHSSSTLSSYCKQASRKRGPSCSVLNSQAPSLQTCAEGKYGICWYMQGRQRVWLGPITKSSIWLHYTSVVAWAGCSSAWTSPRSTSLAAHGSTVQYWAWQSDLNAQVPLLHTLSKNGLSGLWSAADLTCDLPAINGQTLDDPTL